MYDELTTLAGTAKDDFTNVKNDLDSFWSTKLDEVRAVINGADVLNTATLERKVIPKIK